MSAGVEINCYAIVSADDRIADADGKLPPALMNDADWRYFQDELDRCDFTVLGRASHEAAPNHRRRRRIVMSSRATTLEKRADAWWWNARALDWEAVAAELLPRGGRVGVPGGQAAFDYFLPRAAVFHLSRARNATLPGGRGLFAAVERGARAEDALREAGYVADAPTMLDPAASVELTLWRRRALAGDSPRGEEAEEDSP